jgi:transcriptional regulator with XRE-family HTH domain
MKRFLTGLLLASSGCFNNLAIADFFSDVAQTQFLCSVQPEIGARIVISQAAGKKQQEIADKIFSWVEEASDEPSQRIYAELFQGFNNGDDTWSKSQQKELNRTLALHGDLIYAANRYGETLIKQIYADDGEDLRRRWSGKTETAIRDDIFQECTFGQKEFYCDQLAALSAITFKGYSNSEKKRAVKKVLKKWRQENGVDNEVFSGLKTKKELASYADKNAKKLLNNIYRSEKEGLRNGIKGLTLEALTISSKKTCLLDAR